MKKYFLLVLSIYIIAFIWHNSLLDAIHSDGDSLALAAVVQKLLAWIGWSAPTGMLDDVLRKMAHVAEFMVLGGVVSLALSYVSESQIKRFWGALALGLCIAATDELLQLFSDGRACQLTDVGIDGMGVLIGCVLAYLVRRWGWIWLQDGIRVGCTEES